LLRKSEKWLQNGYLLTFVCSGRGRSPANAHLAAQYQLPVSPPDGSILDEVEHHPGEGRLFSGKAGSAAASSFPVSS